MKKLIVFAIAIFGFTRCLFWTNTDTKTVKASATIITPLAVTRPADTDPGGTLNFGSVASAAQAGTVTVSHTSTPTRDVTVVTKVGTSFDNAKFTVTGQSGMTFKVTLDPSVSLTGPGTAMTASLNMSANTTGNALGDFYVGGVLNVGINQTAGDYTGSLVLKLTMNKIISF